MRARNRLAICVAIALSIGYATPVIAQSVLGAPASTVFKFSTPMPLRRMARPEEIASVVGFVAGAGASYLTATTIFADGGIMHDSVGL